MRVSQICIAALSSVGSAHIMEPVQALDDANDAVLPDDLLDDYVMVDVDDEGVEIPDLVADEEAAGLLWNLYGYAGAGVGFVGRVPGAIWNGIYGYTASGLNILGDAASSLVKVEIPPNVPHPNPTVNALDDCQAYVLGSENFSAPDDHGMGEGGRCELEPVNQLPEEKTVRMFFIRHAESTWNDYTTTLASHLVANRQTWLTDAHLSKRGIEGVLGVRDWLFGAPCETADQCFLAGKPREEDEQRRVVFATSNLRRAILTTLIAFWDRITGRDNQITEIHTLSSLQEMVTNIDSTPVTPPKQLPYLTFGNGNCPFVKQDMRNLFVTDCHIQDENAAPEDQKRDILVDFCRWAAHRTVVENATDLVIVGHSIWIRKFFQRFLSAQAQVNAYEAGIRSKVHKMSNEAIVRFDLKFDANGACEIVPNTTQMVRGGMKKRFGLVR